MGLDMYLRGEKYLWSNTDQTITEDGFELKEKILELGYWRKHPNLHGYIVQTFANGEDDCQKIDLDEDSLEQIIDAVKEDKLPKTSGFFFGASDGSEKENTLKILSSALEWLRVTEKNISRSVFYQASW